MAKKFLPDLAYFKQHLTFDAATGVFHWKPRPLSNFKDESVGRSWNTRYARKRAGTLSNGYIIINLEGSLWLAHRLAWLFSTNEWPKHQIDHANGIRHDNRPCNLSDITIAAQRKNQRRVAANKTGVTGVRFTKGRYQAEIGVDGKPVYLGRFKSLSDAAQARKEAEVRYGYHRNHGR